MNYEPALKEARKLLEFGAPNMITTASLKDLVLGVESLIKLDQAIENACDEDTQSDISYEYRILTGEIEREDETK
jgi:hypothetical protein